MSTRTLLLAAAIAGTFSLSLAEAPKGDAIVDSVKVTATVTKIDHKTREITLKSEDGVEGTFVAGDDVKNFGQIKKGDIVTATYVEAIAYEVKKGGGQPAVELSEAAAKAKPGEKPAGAIAQQTKVTVTITAIDRTVPSVTFRGPAGNTRTIKVKHPERLEGVSVGDTVELTYTEALAITVEKAPKK